MVKRSRRPTASGWRRGSLFTLLLFSAMVVAIRMLDVPDASLAGAGTAHDGDTFTIGTERVRLAGIDAPELDQTCRDGEREVACGRLAREELAGFLAGDAVRCEPEGRDRYGRLLARCRVDGHDLGRAMVAAGWALAYGDYRVEEAEARAARRGLWRTEFVPPQDWRAHHGDAAEPGIWGWLLEWL